MQSLRAMRDEREWSRARLARQSGVAAVTIEKLERNNVRPLASTALRLAGALGVSVEELLAERKR